MNGRDRSGSRVAVGLSGGVDSAVAASLLVDQGYDVSAVHLWLWRDQGNHERASARAREIAALIGIPLQELDARVAFRTAVIDHFVREYGAGRTPNPCVLCNALIKFRLLLDETATGAEWAATGHYARVHCAGAGCTLMRGLDSHKDQSYFLYALTQAQLRRILLPLGTWTKCRVRELAHRRGLLPRAADESQDVCFAPDGDYRAFLREAAPELWRPGAILDRLGNRVGDHAGLPGYTVGQRKGLGVGCADRLYVLQIDPTRNALVVGPGSFLDQIVCTIERLHMLDGRMRRAPFEALAQVRYSAPPTAVVVHPTSPEAARVEFASPQRAIAPGQSLVLYQGEQVLGGGIIRSAG